MLHSLGSAHEIHWLMGRGRGGEGKGGAGEERGRGGGGRGGEGEGRTGEGRRRRGGGRGEQGRRGGGGRGWEGGPSPTDAVLLLPPRSHLTSSPRYQPPTSITRSTHPLSRPSVRLTRYRTLLEKVQTEGHACVRLAASLLIFCARGVWWWQALLVGCSVTVGQGDTVPLPSLALAETLALTQTFALAPARPHSRNHLPGP